MIAWPNYAHTVAYRVSPPCSFRRKASNAGVASKSSAAISCFVAPAFRYRVSIKQVCHVRQTVSSLSPSVLNPSFAFKYLQCTPFEHPAPTKSKPSEQALGRTEPFCAI
eukprot:2676862-Rhodomonas_salina.2